MGRRRQLTAVPDTPKRALLYIRVSALMGRAVGSEEFHSPHLQIDAMRRAISTAGMREAGVVEDLDRSGQTFSREGIDKIREMVEARQVDVVALYDLSRLGRNLAESLTFIRWLRDRGVTVMSSQERIDDTPEGQYMLGQFLNLAELYGLQIGRRWAEVALRRARAGRHHGVVPQGYIVDADKNLTVDPVLGPAVTAMFRDYADDAPVAEIMKRLSAARSKPVRRRTVKDMLSNPTFRGRIVLHSSIAGYVEMPGRHDPLVDDATWERVQRRLERDRTVAPRWVEPRYSLSGLVFCAQCRGAMQVWRSPEKAGVLRMVCGRTRQVRDCPGPGSPRFDDIEAAVLADVARYAAQLRGNPAAAAAEKTRRVRAGLDAASLEREIASTREAMGRITTRWATARMPEVAYDKAMAQLVEQERLLEVQIEAAKQAVAGPEPGRVVALVDEMLQVWPDATGTERNRALRAVLVKVHIRRGAWQREPMAARIVGAEYV